MRTFVLALVLVSLSASGCGGESAGDAVPAPTTTASESRGTSDRPPAPSIEGTALTSERVALEGFRGRAVLVNVWSSW
ncbi:MAG: hypothetical protein R6W48_06830 [Gaiellaceae bacterium]